LYENTGRQLRLCLEWVFRRMAQRVHTHQTPWGVYLCGDDHREWAHVLYVFWGWELKVKRYCLLKYTGGVHFGATITLSEMLAWNEYLRVKMEVMEWESAWTVIILWNVSKQCLLYVLFDIWPWCSHEWKVRMVLIWTVKGDIDLCK